MLCPIHEEEFQLRALRRPAYPYGVETTGEFVLFCPKCEGIRLILGEQATSQAQVVTFTVSPDKPREKGS